MWSGPQHVKNFTGRLLRHIESEEAKYGTSSRMKGMITLADEVKSRAPRHIPEFLFNAANRSSKRLFTLPLPE
jgi:hypothetical protein